MNSVIEREDSSLPPVTQETAAVNIGLDDGYAFTKVVLADGRLVSIPSSAKLGRANVTWLDESKTRIFEYETDAQVYSVGDVNPEPTHFDGYPFSSLNRAIVQHALQEAGLAGRSIHAVSGLPVSHFYRKDGSQRRANVEQKRASLKALVQPVDGRAPAGIAFHEVIPEALAAWYDHVITESEGGVRLETDRVKTPIGVVDIGGRTTDYVVVADQGVQHGSSGSLRCGLLDVQREVGEGIRGRFDLEEVSHPAVSEAVRSGVIRLFGKDHDVSVLVNDAERRVVERLHLETQRQFGRGAELERVLFVGGGAVALSGHIRDWFPNQTIVEHPAFSNARGMLKYLKYVCLEA